VKNWLKIIHYIVCFHLQKLKRKHGLTRIRKLKKIPFITDMKPFIITGIGIIAFSNLIVQLFGQTIPSIFMAFFKDVGEIVVITAVFVFALSWALKTRPVKRPKHYNVIIYDVFGKESTIDGLRIEFKTHDVAWSFMKEYKKSYPLYNFALISEFPKTDKKTIFRYI